MMTFFFYLLIFMILGTAAYGAWSSAPYLPTRRRDIERMLKLADIKPGERVYDLGCGDGRLVFASAKAGAEAIGVEVFILPYLFARIKSVWHKGARILYGNFYNYDLRGADVVFIFLTGKAYDKLFKKLEKELKTGSRIVVYCFPINQLRDKLIECDRSDKDLPIYLYKI